MHPVQVALQVAPSELDGAIEPLGLAGATRARASPIPSLTALSPWPPARLWPRGDKKPRVEKKRHHGLPSPDCNVGTAAYLNVFGSIFQVLKELEEEGYDVGDMPADEKTLMESVLNQVCVMRG